MPCENCGKPDTKAKLQKKKFCSPLCAKTAKTSPAEIVDQSGATTATTTTTTNSVSSAAEESAAAASKLEPTADVIKPKPCSDASSPTSANTATVKPTQEQPAAVQPVTVDASLVKSEAIAAAATAAVTASPLTAAAAAQSPTAAVVAAAQPQGPQLHEWSVAEVCDFIRNLPGCSDYAEDFENQEIDGQALLLLKPNNLVSVMGIKLGPALKIIDRVNFMRGAAQDD